MLALTLILTLLNLLTQKDTRLGLGLEGIVLNTSLQCFDAVG